MELKHSLQHNMRQIIPNDRGNLRVNLCANKVFFNKYKKNSEKWLKLVSRTVLLVKA